MTALEANCAHEVLDLLVRICLLAVTSCRAGKPGSSVWGVRNPRAGRVFDLWPMNYTTQLVLIRGLGILASPHKDVSCACMSGT